MSSTASFDSFQEEIKKIAGRKNETWWWETCAYLRWLVKFAVVVKICIQLPTQKVFLWSQCAVSKAYLSLAMISHFHNIEPRTLVDILFPLLNSGTIALLYWQNMDCLADMYDEPQGMDN
jgi:hypothetical protein